MSGPDPQTRAYEVWDVFTDRLHGGNPLAVIPDGRGLDAAQMQAVAREFNLSETVFVLPPDNPAHDARLRIFDPTQELPFAGHPTIGTAICLAAAGRVPAGMVLEEGVGPIACTAQRAAGIWQASFVTSAPFRRHNDVDPAVAAACLGLPLVAIRTDAHGPLLVDKGLPFAVVQLADAAALAAATPDAAAMREAGRALPLPGFDFAVGAYVDLGGGRLSVRMFAPLAGIPEDPATGSLAAALSALRCDLADGPVTLEIEQGVAMGRPSRIMAEALGPDSNGPVRIAGQAVQSMTGRLVLPPANSG